MSLNDIFAGDIEWKDIARCKGEPIELFFDWYENTNYEEFVPPFVDEFCMGCPVQRECAEYALNNSQPGVWGGIYWTMSGKPDPVRNAHKTTEDWKKLEDKLGMDFKEMYG